MKKRKSEDGTISLLRQFLTIRHEQALRRKALRLLEKQEWSVDFLTALLVKAAKLYGSPVEMELTSPSGVKMKLTSVNAQTGLDDSDDIFNHLDDDLAVQRFISKHGRK